MTHQEAIDLLKTDWEPETYADAAEVFAALYGRPAEAEDGDQMMVWSLCCAYEED